MDDGFTRAEAYRIVAAIVALLAVGTVLFMWTLGEAWHAALYRTIVTASLVGLDSTPHGLKAEGVTILVVFCGVAIFGYFATQLFDEIAQGVFSGGWKEKRRHKMIDELHDHIIGGYGRVGRRATEDFRASGVPYVILDFSEEAIAAARENDEPFVQGDGSKEDDLTRAGIERTGAIIVAIRKHGGDLEMRPSKEAKLEEGDVVVGIGSPDEIGELERLFEPRGAVA